MKKIRIVFMIILPLVAVFCLYQTIGNFMRGYNSPILNGTIDAHFMGYYMLTAVYGLFFLLSSIALLVIVILEIKARKNKRRRDITI